MPNTIYRGKVLDKYKKWVNNLDSRLGQLHKNTVDVVVPINETSRLLLTFRLCLFSLHFIILIRDLLIIYNLQIQFMNTVWWQSGTFICIYICYDITWSSIPSLTVSRLRWTVRDVGNLHFVNWRRRLVPPQQITHEAEVPVRFQTLLRTSESKGEFGVYSYTWSWSSYEISDLTPYFRVCLWIWSLLLHVKL